jgi:hypothetical protein
MIYLRSDWWLQWNRFVYSSDSSLYGFGVCTSEWTRDVVARVGRVSERSRFKSLTSVGAREAAFRAHAAIHVDEIVDANGVIDTNDHWERVSDFPEVPSDLLVFKLWKPCLWGAWQFEEDILVLEARALVKGMRRFARTIFGRNVRQLFLVDNMSVCLAFDRSRSRSFRLLIQIRRFRAYCFVRHIKAVVRWIPSEYNAADIPSRIYDPKGDGGCKHADIDPFKTHQSAVVHSVVVTPHVNVQANISGKSVFSLDEAGFLFLLLQKMGPLPRPLTL